MTRGGLVTGFVGDPSGPIGMLRRAMGTSPTLGLGSYLRALLFVIWGVPDGIDPPPRVLIER